MSLADRRIPYDSDSAYCYAEEDVREHVKEANNKVAKLLVTYRVDILAFPDLQEIFNEVFGFKEEQK